MSTNRTGTKFATLRFRPGGGGIYARCCKYLNRHAAVRSALRCFKVASYLNYVIATAPKHTPTYLCTYSTLLGTNRTQPGTYKAYLPGYLHHLTRYSYIQHLIRYRCLQFSHTCALFLSPTSPLSPTLYAHNVFHHAIFTKAPARTRPRSCTDQSPSLL